MIELKPDRFYVSVDIAVFTIHQKQLKILLIQRKNPPFQGKYALPGGFVGLAENFREAATRELKQETGAEVIYLKKLVPFGHVGRDPRGRVITIPFLALIDLEAIRLHSPGEPGLERWHPAWHTVDSLPELAFDHRKILDRAISTLREEIEKSNIAIEIMPEKFTLTELQTAYEIILDKELDKRNFRKKLKELGILKALHESRMDGAHRPARLYAFKSKKYRDM